MSKKNILIGATGLLIALISLILLSTIQNKEDNFIKDSQILEIKENKIEVVKENHPYLEKEKSIKLSNEQQGIFIVLKDKVNKEKISSNIRFTDELRNGYAFTLKLYQDNILEIVPNDEGLLFSGKMLYVEIKEDALEGKKIKPFHYYIVKAANFKDGRAYLQFKFDKVEE